jgi:WD40 repeat protein
MGHLMSTTGWEDLPTLCMGVLCAVVAIVTVHYAMAMLQRKPPWRDARYDLWWQEEMHSEPGLGPALQRLAFASLMHPRLAEDAPQEASDVPVEVFDAAGEAVSRAIGFHGVLAGHTGIVWSASFSPDGEKVVSASDDRTVRIWSAVTGECEQSLAGHTGEVKSASFSHDGEKVVSASDDRTVRIWSAVTGECEQTLAGHTGIVMSASFSHDGEKVVSASSDRTVRIWSAVTGECEQSLAGHTDWVFSASFSHDGEKVVSASGDKVRVWRVDRC